MFEINISVKDKTALILGGAGFVGSNLAARFVRGGYKVTVIDGLLPKTGGSAENLAAISSKIRFIQKKIENVNNLGALIASSSVIIDCMAWTSHNLAILDPLYDLELNVLSHLILIKSLKNAKGKKVIFLGSRSQYGKLAKRRIVEDDVMVPVDVQGIGKLAAESYFRIYSQVYGFSIVSLRFGNCFGPNQKVEGEDIGLAGSFIKEALAGEKIQVYGKERHRNVVYVGDLAEVIFELTQKELSGFEAYNLSGQTIKIRDLAEKIIKIAGSGSFEFAKMPRDIEILDIGEGVLNESKIRRFLGEIPKTVINQALEETCDYFSKNLDK